MPNFKYTALDQNGVEKTGIITADSKIAAAEMIRAQGLLLRECEEAAKGAKPGPAKEAKKKGAKGKKKEPKGGKAGGAVSQKELMIFTRQLATLISAGLPLLQSLNVLNKQEPNPNLRATIGALGEAVQGGSTFSEALSAYPKMFNRLFVNMVKAGEIGGVLEVVLNRLAEYQEKANKLRGKITSAMVYPLIIMVIAVGILHHAAFALFERNGEKFDLTGKAAVIFCSSGMKCLTFRSGYSVGYDVGITAQIELIRCGIVLAHDLFSFIIKVWLFYCKIQPDFLIARKKHPRDRIFLKNNVKK